LQHRDNQTFCFLRETIERLGASFVVTRTPQTEGSSSMDREHIKGTAEKAKGAIKDAAGKVTGDKKLQTEGKLDKAKGTAHNVAGDVRESIEQSND
jgi:uncharacterized protein YjbJ (UPF0337 family)